MLNNRSTQQPAIFGRRKGPAAHKALILRPKELAVEMIHGRGMLLYVRQGLVHVTQVADRYDYLVSAGETLLLDHHGAAVIQALQASQVDISPHS